MIRRFRDWSTRIYAVLDKLNFSEYSIFSFYAIIIGVSVGFAAVLFHEAIHFFTHLFFDIGTDKLSFLGVAVVILFPVVGMLIQSFMIKMAPDTAKKKGVSNIIQAVAIQGGYIKLKTTIFHFLAPAINIGSGGTIGPEGPAAQIGAGVASKIGQLFRLSDARRRMFTAAGSGAVIAAVFNTPLGGVFFALEVILLNEFRSSTFSALILATVSASAVSRTFLGNSRAFLFDHVFIGSYDQFYFYILLGLAAGVLSAFFIKYSDGMDLFFKKNFLTILPRPLIMALVGLLVGVSGYFYKDIFGIGYHAINEILVGSISWQTILVLLGLKFGSR